MQELVAKKSYASTITFTADKIPLEKNLLTLEGPSSTVVAMGEKCFEC